MNRSTVSLPHPIALSAAVVAFAAFTAASLAVSNTSSASVCALSLRNQVRGAAFILEAELVEVHGYVATFRTVAVYKGAPPVQVTVHGSRRTITPSASNVGDTYLLFLGRSRGRLNIMCGSSDLLRAVPSHILDGLEAQGLSRRTANPRDSAD